MNTVLERPIRELATLEGSGAVRRLPIDNPFNSLYEIKPTVAGL